MAGIPYVSDPLQMLWQFQQDQARTDLLNNQARLVNANTQEQQIKNLLMGHGIQANNLIQQAANEVSGGGGQAAPAAQAPAQPALRPDAYQGPMPNGEAVTPPPTARAPQQRPQLSPIEEAAQDLDSRMQTAMQYEQIVAKARAKGVQQEYLTPYITKAQEIRKQAADDRIKLMTEQGKQLEQIGGIAGGVADARTPETLALAIREIAAIDPRILGKLPVEFDPATGQVVPSDKTYQAFSALSQMSMDRAKQLKAQNDVATLLQTQARDKETARKNVANEANQDARTGIYREAVAAQTKNAATNEARLAASATLQEGTLDDNTAKFAAETFLKTGVLPNLGYGKAGAANRQQVLAMAAELAKEQGKTGTDVAAARGAFRADTASLTQITKSLDAITSFTNTAIKNGDVLVKMAQDVDATGVPIIEKWIRAGRQATGDPKVAAFNAQMRVYIPEVAKILTNPNLTGQLTDTARKEIESVVSGGASAQQILAIHNTLKTDFANRENAMKDQLAEIKARMGDKKAAPASSGPKQIKSAEEYNALPAGSVYVDPNGVQRTKQ